MSTTQTQKNKANRQTVSDTHVLLLSAYVNGSYHRAVVDIDDLTHEGYTYSATAIEMPFVGSSDSMNGVPVAITDLERTLSNALNSVKGDTISVRLMLVDRSVSDVNLFDTGELLKLRAWKLNHKTGKITGRLVPAKSVQEPANFGRVRPDLYPALAWIAR